MITCRLVDNLTGESGDLRREAGAVEAVASLLTRGMHAWTPFRPTMCAIGISPTGTRGVDLLGGRY